MKLDLNLIQCFENQFPLFNHLPKADQVFSVRDDDGYEKQIFVLPSIGRDFGAMERGKCYFKPSNITIGRCNGIEADICRNGMR